MADEESAAPVEVSDTPAPIEAAVADQTVDLEEARLSQFDEVQEAAPESEEPPAEEFDEIDFDGKKYQVPKGLKSGFMMQSDYTQKTQAVSARSKELDERAARIEQQSKVTEEELDMRSDLRSVEKRIKSYAEATREQWQQWSEQDPLAAQDGWREYQMLKDEQTKLTETLNKAQSARTETVQQETAKRLQETGEFARKQPGWTPEVEAKVLDYAQSEGLSKEFLRENISPAYYSILYKAMLGAEALKKPAAPKIVPQPTPLSTVGAKSNAPVSKSLADMNMTEYAALRKKQMAAKGR